MEIILTVFLVLSLISLLSAIIYIVNIHKKIKDEERLLENAQEVADKLVNDAKRDADSFMKSAEISARELELELKDRADREIKERRNEIGLQENRLFQKEEQLGRKEDKIDRKLQNLSDREKKLDFREQKIENLENEKEEILRQISELSKEEAEAIILEKLDKQLSSKKADLIKKYEDDTKYRANKIAKEIISNAIQKCAADHTSETTVSVVSIPNDEIKGRIIGKEGRNIRTLENLTGVQFIIDDTPEAITISAFDPVRREVARIALQKLIEDGRIHPAKIEEMVEKAVLEINEVIKEAGQNAAEESGVNGLTNEELLLLGKLKYRTSYGQNVLTHSIEVANLANIMAGLIGADKTLATKGGLLHDIGKALDHDPEIQGTHVELGVEVLKRNKESKEVINAVEAHHGDVPPETVEAVLVQAADAISASRPGARRDTFEAYIKRLESLENLANSFDSVDKSFAIQAGRELRLIVNPKKITDDEMKVLAHEVATKIEEEVAFPGQIKVNVLRETRRTDYAKKSRVNM